MDKENKQVTQWLFTRRIEPSWLRTNRLEEEKIGSGDLIKMDAYERDGIMEEDSCSERSNQLERKRAGTSSEPRNDSRAGNQFSVMNKPARCKEISWLRSNEPNSSGQEQGGTEQVQLCTKADGKSKLEISSRAIANKSSRVEEATSSKQRSAQCKPERKQAGKLVNVKQAR
ncbi:hypothetical protein F511_27422 [Dorcoceras hygrometricum]|uniref:Uncharacterized protein n=1 Tax=Dorcoceras hygrometricum TaxID=472368 RepID=A0A2Z7AHA4_9LAMI|nr:hypothetical protein F511_27422 [Dorcoceras hygrometricum]